MKKICRWLFWALLVCFVFFGIIWFFSTTSIAVLDPKGMIALQQRSLLSLATQLMLIIVIPVLIMTAFFAWKYRAGKKRGKYQPDWDHSTTVEMIWWGIPLVIVAILAVFNWKGCIQLDPFKPLVSEKKAVKVQVVALQWKWLFIYPEFQIATVNALHIPEKTPINFEITADAPMNSFWIPQLGGQVYAMPGMRSKLHLIANETGNFQGSSANLSGTGFAGMRFVTTATSDQDFAEWVETVRHSPQSLDPETYANLVLPTINNRVEFYRTIDKDLFETIIMKYMDMGH